MRANELRIGNLVSMGDYGVQSISSYNIYKLNLMELGTKVADYYYLIEPIPLTEEWLVKFGFESDNNEPNEIYSVDISTDERYDYVSTLRIIVMDDFCLVDIVEKGTHPRADESIVTLKSIKHVHSLQNLIFALTGEELTLKQ